MAAWEAPFSRSGDATFDVRLRHRGHLVGVSRQHSPVALFPLDRPYSAPGRVIGNVRLRFDPRVVVAMDDERFESAVAVLECRDSSLVTTFAALVVDVFRHCTDAPESPKRVLAAFSSWNDLLAVRPALDAPGERGLWGELAVLRAMPCRVSGLAAWGGPEGTEVDFLGAGIAFEVKTTIRRFQHTLRWNQARFEDSDYATYLVSVHLEKDPVDGETLPELVSDVAKSIVDESEFRRKLLKAGYREQHAYRYDTRYSLADPLIGFSMSEVPCIGELPPGVHKVRWDVDLSNIARLPDETTSDLLRRIGGAND